MLAKDSQTNRLTDKVTYRGGTPSKNMAKRIEINFTFFLDKTLNEPTKGRLKK